MWLLPSSLLTTTEPLRLVIKSVTDSSEDWIFQQMSLEGIRGPDPALVNPLLFGKVLRHMPSLCQSPQAQARTEVCPYALYESQSWCVKVKKRGTTGKDGAVTSCTGLTRNQRHCTSPDWAVRLDWMWETQCYLLLVFQSAFQMPLPPVPPQHFTESPLWEFVALV